MKTGGRLLQGRKTAAVKRMELLKNYTKWKSTLAVFLAAVVLVAGGSMPGFAKAGRQEQEPYKYYSSILIKKGDTLWSIASAHITPECGGIEEYIEELRSLNRLYDDGIYAGAYLTIPCYTTVRPGIL